MSIKSSISDFFKAEELKDNVLKIAEAKFELKKLELIAKLESMLTKGIMKTLVYLIYFTIFLLFNLLLAALINHYTRNFWIGYACLIGFYTLLLLLFHFNKGGVSRFIKNRISDFINREDL